MEQQPYSNPPKPNEVMSRMLDRRHPRKPNGYWTFERCYAEAKKYITKKDFQRYSQTAYSISNRKGWGKHFSWLSSAKGRVSKWTQEKCFWAAKQCRYATEFYRKFNSAYWMAKKNGWDKNYDWFENTGRIISLKKTKWTYDACIEVAKKCRTMHEFMDRYPFVYIKCREKNWLDDFVWLERHGTPYQEYRMSVYVFLIEELGAVYVGITVDPSARLLQHRKEGSVYKYVKDKNIDFPQMKILETGLSIDEAKEKEGKYIEKYKREGWYMINKMKAGMISSSVGALGRGKWTKKRCFQVALECKTPSELKRRHIGAYKMARRHGWIRDYTWFENGRELAPRVFLDELRHKSLAAAKTCKSYKEFLYRYPMYYSAAKRHNWFKDYSWSPRRRTNKDHAIIQLTKEGGFIKRFANITEASLQTGLRKGGIEMCCQGINLSAYNYIWRYEDDIKDYIKIPA